MKLCLECGHIFDQDDTIKIKDNCPVLYCPGKVVEIDDPILETIRLLNRKGFTTEGSCAGHTWGDYEPYVHFTCGIHKYAFPILPQSFEYRFYWENFRLQKCITVTKEFEKLKAISDSSIDLLVWAEQIPQAKILRVAFRLNAGTKLSKFIFDVDRYLYLFKPKVKKSAEGIHELIFTTKLCQINLKPLVKEIKAFAKLMSVQVSIEKLE